MAKQKLPVFCQLTFLLLSVFLALAYSDIVQYCWSGTEDDMTGWRNLSCVSGHTTLGNSIAIKTLPSENSTTQAVPVLKPRNFYCMVFQYNETVKGREVKTEFQAEYTCDFDDVCQGRTMLDGYKFRYKGKDGILHCCNSSNNCNTHQLIYKRIHQQTCYFADSADRSLRIEYCPHQRSQCIRNITKKAVPENHEVETIREQYSCDVNGQVCGELGLNESYSHSCKEFTEGVIETHVCCCQMDNCYKPGWAESYNPSAAVNRKVPNSWQKTFLIIIGVALGILVIGISIFFLKKSFVNIKSTDHSSRPKHYSRTTYRSVVVKTGGEDDTVQILPSAV